VGIWEDHLPRLNTRERPIVHKYREGKVKSTPVRGVKENLKPCVYKRWKPGDGWGNLVIWATAYLLHNGPTSYST
jgi:hypothetical protein